MIECAAWGTWSGWIEEDSRRRALRGRRDGGAALDPLEERLGLNDFPGRWNPRRELPPQIEPLALAAARALARAGWWVPGSGARVGGGLVVSLDGGALDSALDFARQIRGGSPRSVSPTAFLFSLPSAAASVLGLLFGLSDYQATVAAGPLSGVRALGHAVDLLALGRLDRVLVAALSVAEGEQARALPSSGGRTARLAAALCLSRAAAAGGAAGGQDVAVAIEVAAGGRRSPAPVEAFAPPASGPHRLPGCFEHLAALPLARLASWLGPTRRPPAGSGTTIHHRDPWREERGSITARMRG
jgi:hypothetical protein